MAHIDKWVCDNCGNEISEEIKLANNTTIAVGDKLHFVGDLCNDCRALLEGDIKSNQKNANEPN